MKILEKIIINDLEYSILEMSETDYDAITHDNDLPLNGYYIVYYGNIVIDDRSITYPTIGYLWSDIKPQDTFETIRECKLAIECYYYKHLLLDTKVYNKDDLNRINDVIKNI